MAVQDNLLLLPDDTIRWTEIKRTILSAVEQKSDILALVSHLDYIENLVHLSCPTSRLFDLLPVRMTFIGLGNYITDLSTEEQTRIQDTLLPFVFQCAVDIENFRDLRLPYCVSNQDYSVSIPFDLIISIIACSFLCILPTHPSSGFLMNEANFTYFFASINDSTCPQAQKLRSLFLYFEYCRTNRSMLDKVPYTLRITRRVLPLNLSSIPSTLYPSNRQQLLENGKNDLIRALSSTPLPCLLVDHYRSIECVADRLQIPMTHFVNAYVGGNVLRSDVPNEDSLFMRYPDLLTCLPLCHRLEDAEALWVDHYRGPFHPVTEDRTTKVAASNLQWRRLVIMNSSCFPNWATDLQYSDAYVISDTIKACAAFFGVSQSDVSGCSVAPPFSTSWWLSHLEHMETNKSRSKPKPFTARSLNRNELVLTNRANRVLMLAEKFIKCVLDDGRKQAWKLRAGLSPDHAPYNQLERCHSSIQFGVSSLGSELVKPVPIRSPQKHDSTFQLQKSPSHSTWYQTQQPYSLSRDPSLEHAYLDMHSSPRVSLAGSFASGSASCSHSSSRSSISRGRSLSTQSSLRRLSDLSSTGSGWLPNTRATDGPSELHELMENDAETISPFVDTIHDPITHQLTSSTMTSPTKFVANDPTQNCDKPTDDRTTPTMTDQMQSEVRQKRCLIPYVNRWIQEACNEATFLVCMRNHQLHQFATDLSRRSISEAVKVTAWFNQLSHKLLLEATKKAEQLHLSDAFSSGPNASRHMSHTTRCCHRLQHLQPKWIGDPIEGQELRQWTSAGNIHTRSSTTCSRESSSQGNMRMRTYSRSCFHAFVKRQRCRLCANLSNIGSSRHLKYLHLSTSAFASRIGSDAAASITGRCFGVSSKRGHSTGLCFKRPISHHHEKTSAFDGTAIQRSDPPSTGTSTNSVAPRAVRIHVTEQLYRFAGSVASECCASAMQQLRYPKIFARSVDTRRESMIRPAGVVTSSWGKHTINPTADPQLKVMTQWIAAAVASSVLPTENQCSPTLDGSKATDKDDCKGDLSSFLRTWLDTNSNRFGSYRISPLIVCTNNDPRLKELDDIVNLIYAAGCTAGTLLDLLLEYGHYRLTSNDSSLCKTFPEQCGTQSLFDFIRARLESPTMTSGARTCGLPVC